MEAIMSKEARWSGSLYRRSHPVHADGVRSVFHLTLRATEGFVRSVFELIDLELAVPDYTTICKRSKCLEVSLPRKAKGPLHAVLDSTGLKVFGEGE